MCNYLERNSKDEVNTIGSTNNSTKDQGKNINKQVKIKITGIQILSGVS